MQTQFGFRAVGDRCAANLAQMNLPIDVDMAVKLMQQKKIVPVAVDLISLARECIGRTRYLRGVSRALAPALVDCSTFVAWLYGRRGIWLPRRTIQQRAFGEVVSLPDLIRDDLVFTTGRNNYYETDPADAVGHVGIATGEGTVIHAANSRIGVKEVDLGEFQNAMTFRGARRYILESEQTTTFVSPDEPIETSDDFRWLILRQIKRT